MPEIIGVFDLGTARIETSKGPVNVGAISIRTSENESMPVDYIGYCRLNYKDSIIKNLKRIHWLKPPEVKLPANAVVPAPPSVIPAEAGIQENAAETQEDNNEGISPALESAG